MGMNEKGEAPQYGQPGQPGGPENGWQSQGQQPGQQAGPQPGVMYQFVPGAGFMPVNCQPGQWGCPPYGYMGGHLGFGPQPHFQQAPPGYGPQANPYVPPYGQPYGPDGHEAHEAHHSHYGPYGPQGPDMGQMYGMVGDVMNGKGDPGKLLGMLQAPGGEFWKGALVGAAAVLLFNSGAVKDALGGLFGAMGGQQEGAGCAAESSSAAEKEG